MKPLYRNLLIIGIAMGVVATSLILGIGQTLLIQTNHLKDTELGKYVIHQVSKENSIRGMFLPFARDIQSWLPKDVFSSVIAINFNPISLKIGNEFKEISNE